MDGERRRESYCEGWVIYSRKVSQLQNQHHGQPTRDQTRRQQYQRHPKRRLTFRIEDPSHEQIRLRLLRLRRQARRPLKVDKSAIRVRELDRAVVASAAARPPPA